MPSEINFPKFLRFGAFVAALVCFNWVTAHAATPSFANGVTNGFINSGNIYEASGLVVSRQNPGVIWTHNDGTFDGYVFAIATNGMLLAQHYVPGAFGVNTEDIAIGPGPLPQFQYIYLGDIGDNFLSRPSVRVFRFPEPAVYPHESNSIPTTPIFDADEITLRYPDGPQDCEGLMLDPRTGDLLLATKLTNSSRIYRATRAQLNSTNDITLTFLHETGSSVRSVSAADVSSDGGLVATRRANRISGWARAANETVGDALARASATWPIIGTAAGELNGEALGFAPEGAGYYTLSEGYLQPLHWFARTDALPTAPRVFVAPGGVWHYSDDGEAPFANWRTATNDLWLSGIAPFGYGGGERTEINYDVVFDKRPAAYFRKTFSVSSLITSNLALRICFNDGVAVYLNGTNILRRNLAADATETTRATASNTDQWRTWFSYPVPPSLVKLGTNVLAVELHRADADGAYLNFDLQLVEARVEAPARVLLARRVGTNCVVSLSGPTGLVARVESSADLQTWSSERDLFLGNGTAVFTNAFALPQRFFRVAP